jgi:hypothetical protein
MSDEQRSTGPHSTINNVMKLVRTATRFLIQIATSIIVLTTIISLLIGPLSRSNRFAAHVILWAIVLASTGVMSLFISSVFLGFPERGAVVFARLFDQDKMAIQQDKMAIQNDGKTALVIGPDHPSLPESTKEDPGGGDRFDRIAALSKRQPISIEGASIVLDAPEYFFNVLRLHGGVLLTIRQFGKSDKDTVYSILSRLFRITPTRLKKRDLSCRRSRICRLQGAAKRIPHAATSGDGWGRAGRAKGGRPSARCFPQSPGSGRLLPRLRPRLRRSCGLQARPVRRSGRHRLPVDRRGARSIRPDAGRTGCLPPSPSAVSLVSFVRSFERSRRWTGGENHL